MPSSKNKTAAKKTAPLQQPRLDMTDLLNRWIEGTGHSEAEVYRLVYDHLHRIAAGQMRRERADPMLQTTALVNDAFLRMARHESIRFRDREHFFAFAARVMRQVLVDYARGRQRQRRGGLSIVVGLDDLGACETSNGAVDAGSEDVLAVHQVLGDLESFDPEGALIVEMRFFAGLSVPETARALGCSEATVHRRWRLTRAWLYDALRAGAVP